LETDAPASVSASGSVTFEVKLTTAAVGVYSGTISIANSDADENPYNFSITGYGYDGAKALQTIIFTALPVRIIGNPDFNPGAISSAGLTITYTSSNTSVATIVSGQIRVSTTNAGTSIITASQTGDAATNPANNVTQILTVTPVLPPAGSNLISNPSFDSGTTGWSFANNREGAATLVAVPLSGYDTNTAGVTVTNIGTSNSIDNIQLSFNRVFVQTGKNYLISFRGSAAARNISLVLLMSGSPWQTVFSRTGIPLTPTPTNFGPYSFTSNFTGYVDFRFHLGGAASLNAPVYLDNISIMEEKPAATTWNGSAWSDGTPDLDIEAIIAGNYSTAASPSGNGSFTAKKLTVNTGLLTVATGTNVTITNEIINNVGAAAIVLENNANLIQSAATTTNTGAITVKRNSNPLYRLDYTMWSSPVTGSQTLIDFSPLTTIGRFYEYNSGTNLYNVLPNATLFSQGKGFLIRMPNSDAALGYNAGSATLTYNGVFTGIPNNGNVIVAGTSGQFVAVGNPYPSTISADSFINANTNSAGNGVLYFWRKRNNVGATAYATYTLLGGSGAGVTNGGFTPNGTIAVGQGFIIAAPSTGTITFTNAMRTSSNSAPFFRTKQLEKNRVWINLSAGTNPVNQMLVGYMDGATTGVDAGIDGKYINDSPTALTSDINNEEYVIQGRALPFNDTDVVNLNFKTDAAGDFTIAKDHVDGLFANGQAVFLVDKTTGTETNLQTDAYTFISAVGIFNSRFKLTYKTSVGLNINKAIFDENSISVYKQNGVLTINAGKIIMNNVKVFDITGRMILEHKAVNATTTSLRNLALPKQTLLIKITTDANEIVTKKVIY